MNKSAFSNSMIFVAVTAFIWSLHCGENFTTALVGNIIIGAVVAPIIYRWLSAEDPPEPSEDGEY